MKNTDELKDGMESHFTMRDVFDDWKEIKKEEARSKNDAMVAFLKDLSYPVERKNGGYHLVLKTGSAIFDIYPTKLKWCVRDGRYNWRYGIHALMEGLSMFDVKKKTQDEA